MDSTGIKLVGKDGIYSTAFSGTAIMIRVKLGFLRRPHLMAVTRGSRQPLQEFNTEAEGLLASIIKS